MIAVAGATGAIGAELVSLLSSAGADVRALVRNADRARQRLGPDAALRVVDLGSPGTVRPALDGVDSLFLLSSDPGTEPGVVDAAVEAGVGRIVKSSAIGFGEEPPPGHAEAEQHVMASGAAWTVLRPNAFMHTVAQYLPAITGPDGVFELPAGQGRTAFVDTRDIAAVAAAVLLAPHTDNRVHLVTGPQALSMADVAQAIAAATGTSRRYRAVDADQARRTMRERGLGPMAGFLAGHYSAVAAGGFDVVSDTVPRLTGRPARSFSAFVNEDPQRWQAGHPA